MANTKLGDVTITKQSNTILTLFTEKKYVSDNVYFDINVQNGAGTVSVTATNAEIQSDQSGRNISDVIGTKSSDAPLTGYYFKVDATGVGASAVTTAGWFETGSIGSTTATGSYYFPIDTATALITGSNTVTPSASVTGNNLILSNVNNGISVTATGGGTASASATVTSTQAGYVPNNTVLDIQTIAGENQSTSASSYVSGVVLTAPVSGTNSFSITVPNGLSDTVTFRFVVDSQGNVSIEDLTTTQ